MEFIHIIVVAIVQGITEFLPISSTGHLIMAPALFGWSDQGLIIDIAVHIGTLGAALVYLWRDIWSIIRGTFRRIGGRRDPGATLFLYLIIGSVPVVVAGLLVKEYVSEELRTVEIVGWTTLVFGLLLLAADRIAMTVRKIEHMTWANALFIGLMQVLALVPGTSRAGITMTAARMLGFERREAARFSLLLAIPAIAGAGLLGIIDLFKSGNLQLRADALLTCGLSFAVALIAITTLMHWLSRWSFTPFVTYRVIIGLAILGWVYGVY